MSFSVHGQKIASLENSKKLKQTFNKVVKELSNAIEVSSYQQKSTVKVLVKAAQERKKIETTIKGASRRTEALETLEKKEEYSLRTVLNNQQYEMLLSILEKD